MTQETLSGPPQDTLERALSLTAGVFALGFWVVVLWQQLDLEPTPAEALERLRDRVTARRRWRAAMESQLIEIVELPELEPDEEPPA